MGNINIYKIDANKYQSFYGAISEKLNQVDSKDIVKNYNSTRIVFGMTLFVAAVQPPNFGVLSKDLAIA